MVRVAPEPNEAESQVATILLAALPRWKVRRTPRGGAGPDFALSGPRGAALHVEVKSARDTRLDTVEGALARAILCLQRLNIEGSTPVVALRVPHMGPRTVDQVRAYMAEHAPAMGWVIVVSPVDYAVQIPGLDVSKRVAEPRLATPVRPGSSTSPLFTDLNCWLLKVLLLADAPARLWSGPRGAVHTPMDLMRAGAVSRLTAYRFVRTFTEADYLRATPDGLQIVRRAALIRAWRGEADGAVVHATPVRWQLGRPSRLEDVFDLAKMRYAVTGFEACRRLGALHASSKRTEVYVDDVAGGLRSLDLAISGTGDADFYLLPANQSVVRGAARVGDVSVVDVLQAAIDVDRNAARGREQSDYLLHEVLGWRDV